MPAGWSKIRGPRDMSRLYAQALAMLASPHGPRGVRSGGGAAGRPRPLRPAPFGAGAAAGPAAGGSGRAVYQRHLEPLQPRARTTHPDDTDLYGWDTHNDIFDALKDRLLPRFDESFSALIEDLDQRGLLGPDARRVHGRVRPRAAGRAGAEIRRGDARPQALGQRLFDRRGRGGRAARARCSARSDRLGAEPIDRALRPVGRGGDDVSRPGHRSARGHYVDPLDRPFAIATGRPIGGLYHSQAAR